MEYLFNYTITARCHLLSNCFGIPYDIIHNWTRLTTQDGAFVVDNEGWLRREGGEQNIAGYYNPAATGESDYSFVVPIIASQLRSGAIGVAFRVQDRNNYYAFLWDDGHLEWTNRQRLIRVRNGVPTILAESDSTIAAGYPVIIGVTVTSNRLIVRVGSDVAFDYTDTYDPILIGSYGIAVIEGNGSRFAGVYRNYIRDENVSRPFSAILTPDSLGIINSKVVNAATATDLLRNDVNQRRSQLGVPPEELVVYGYSVVTIDPFAQAYFDVGEPVVYSQYGDSYTYAYLKQTPRVPDAPTNFRGEIVGFHIDWRWMDVSSLETEYVLAKPTDEVVATLPANTTSHLEKITEDGMTVTRRLYARNSVGNSPYVEASVFVPVINPGMVSFFGGQAVSPRAILWVWSELEYAEEYELLDEEGRVIARLPAGTSSYREDNLESDKYYTRELRAVRKGVYGPTAQATVGVFSAVSTLIVPAPTLFKGESIGDRTIRWFWEYTGNPAGFLIFDIAGTIITEVAGNLRDFIEHDLEPGKTYIRILVAKDAGGHISAPLTAECTAGERFEPDECPVPPPEPELIEGFDSGIGDGDDLLTGIETGPVKAKALIRAVGTQEVEEEVLEPSPCRVRFVGEGEEIVTRDYGQYRVTAAVEQPADIRFQLKAEVPQPIDCRYRLEADVLRYNCYPTDLPFSGKVLGLARKTNVLEALGEYTVNCEAEIIRGLDIEFNYQLEITYTSTDPANRIPVDIIWIVDSSGSMDPYMSAVADNAQLFASSLQQANIDYRLGVVGYEHNAYKRYHGSDEWTTVPSAFASMVQIPTSGGTENGIKAILYALSSYSFRPGALKYFIVLTDEDADDAGWQSTSNLINTLKSANVVLSAIRDSRFNDYPYPQIASGTGGVTASIYTSNWAQTLLQVVDNIVGYATLSATLSSTATACYGDTYDLADERTLDEIIADLIADGGTSLPSDFFTSGYNIITSYQLITPKINGVYIRLSTGGGTTTDGNAHVEAYSERIGITEKVIFTAGPFSVSADADHTSPETALCSEKTCREIIAPLIDDYLATNENTKVTPLVYWVESSGGIRAFTSPAGGFDYVRWYRADWDEFLVTWEAGVAGTLLPEHTSGSPLLVSSTSAEDIFTASLDEGYEPAGEMLMLGSLKWRYASAPFDGHKQEAVYTSGVLEAKPSVACFIKDIYLTEQPDEADIFIASDDGMALYINGVLIIDNTTQHHAQQYWNYTLDIKNYLVVGRNRIAVLVDNGYQNNGTLSGYFDCELSVVINGETSYLIRRGIDDYGSEESMWWCHGEPASVVMPQGDPLERPWYHKDYGWVDIGAWRAESSTPGAALYIDADGYVYAHPTRELTSCEDPAVGILELTVYMSGFAGNRPVNTGKLLMAKEYAISGPGNVKLTEASIMREFWPWIELVQRLFAPTALTSVVFDVACTGNAQSSTAADGSGPLQLSTTRHTWQPVFEQFTFVTEATELRLNDDTSSSNPQVILSEAPTQPLVLRVGGQYQGEVLEKKEAIGPEVIKNGSYGISTDGKVVWFVSGYMETSFEPSTGVMVQFNRSDHNDGAVRVYVDGIERALFHTRNCGNNFIYICGLPNTSHTIKIEPAGGGDLHVEYFASINVTASATLPLLSQMTPVSEGDSSWFIKQVRAVKEDGDCIVYTANGGYGYVYAYATRPPYHYTIWNYRRTILPMDGEALLAETADLTPLDKFGQPYLGDDVNWYIVPIELPEGVFIYWDDAEEGRVLGRNTLRLAEKTAAGVALADRELKIEMDEIEVEGKVVTVVTVEGDNNVYVRVAPYGSTVRAGERDIAPGVNRVIYISAVEVDEVRDWTYYGSWYDLDVAGEVLLRPDIPLSERITPERIWYELEGESVSAAFLSGGDETDSVFDLLRITGGITVTKNVTKPWYGDETIVEAAVLQEAELVVTVPLPQEGNVSGLMWSCQSLTPGIDPSIVSIVSDEESGEALITVRFELFSPACLTWRPVTQGGYYYYLGQERYLFGNPPESCRAVLDGTLTARLTPGAKAPAPVVVTLEDGTPLRPVYGEDGGLTVKEVLRGNGSNYLLLAYNNIDEDSASVRFRPMSISDCAPEPKDGGPWYAVEFFQICGNKLKLPITVRTFDTVEITYCLRDSFAARVKGDTTIIEVHSDMVSPGDSVLVYYETADDGLRHWKQLDLNPLRQGHDTGFLKIAPAGQPVSRLEVIPARTTVSADDTAPLYITVLAVSASGTVVKDAEITLVCGERQPQSALTSDRGAAFFSIPGPFEEGELPIYLSCGVIQKSFTVFVAPSADSIELDVLVDKHVLYPEERLIIRATACINGQPTQGMEIAAQGIGIIPQSTLTDMNGTALFLMTAPTYSGIFPVTLTCNGVVRALMLRVLEPVTLATVENTVDDISASYTVNRLGYYDIITLATTPPEWL